MITGYTFKVTTSPDAKTYMKYLIEMKFNPPTLV